MHKSVLPGKLIMELNGRPVLSYRCEHGLQCNRGDLVFAEKGKKIIHLFTGKILQHDHLIAEIASQIKLGGGMKSRNLKKISQRMKKFRRSDDPCLNLLTVQIAVDLAKPFRIIEIIQKSFWLCVHIVLYLISEKYLAEFSVLQKNRRNIHIQVCKLLFTMCREADLNLRSLSRLAGVSKPIIFPIKNLKTPVGVINCNISAAGLAFPLSGKDG